ncbi:MAG: V-type ATP synthase subunit I [Oscillospiraceae bacterium]
MKKATIIALRRDRQALLLALQRSSIMMITENDGDVFDEALGQTEQKVADAKSALSFISKYREKGAGFFSQAPTVSYDELIKRKKDGERLTKEAEDTKSALAAIDSKIASDRAALELYLPWLPLEIPLDELRDTRTARVHTGYIPQSSVSKLDATRELGASVTMLGSLGGSSAALIVCHKSADNDIMNAVKALGFIESAPPTAKATAREQYESLQKRIEASACEKTALLEKARVIAKEASSIELLYDKLCSDMKRQQTAFKETAATFYIEGWIEASRADELDEALREVTDIFELVCEDPAEGERPPTLLHNNALVQPYESLTDMFSRPSPAEGIDPNPIMAPWYWIIFGMMMADVGYGLVLAIGSFLLLKIKNPPKGGMMESLLKIFMFGSVTTMLWGVAFGSYFGAEWFPPLLFTPLNNPIGLLLVSCGVGILHLFTAIIAKMYYLIKAGHVKEAIFAQFSWIMLISGGLCLFVPALAVFGKYCALTAVAMLVFLSKPNKNIFKRIIGGLGSIYNITGFFSDILSYSRIMALMLSSGIMAMVMNMLAGMLQGNPIGFAVSIFVYLFGHVFNLAMGLLSAYVHSSRLQFLEFYGKFYDGGGYEFKPLSPAARYNIVTK